MYDKIEEAVNYIEGMPQADDEKISIEITADILWVNVGNKRKALTHFAIEQAISNIIILTIKGLISKDDFYEQIR